jgi:hypothetical protein
MIDLLYTSCKSHGCETTNPAVKTKSEWKNNGEALRRSFFSFRRERSVSHCTEYDTSRDVHLRLLISPDKFLCQKRTLIIMVPLIVSGAGYKHICNRISMKLGYTTLDNDSLVSRLFPAVICNRSA